MSSFVVVGIPENFKDFFVVGTFSSIDDADAWIRMNIYSHSDCTFTVRELQPGWLT
jgi:hypothetical protein